MTRAHKDEPADWALERGLVRGWEVLEEGGALEGAALFSSTPCPRHNGQELCPVVNHCEPRQRSCSEDWESRWTCLVNALPMKGMVASGQLPHFFLRLVIAETDQTTLAGRYLHGVTSFERVCYQ